VGVLTQVRNKSEYNIGNKGGNMDIIAQISETLTNYLSPVELFHMLPKVLNIVNVVLSKGEKQLSPESAIWIQVEIEKLRSGL
jgi:hypothetical protein